MTRAVHAACTGDLVQAIAFNPMVLLLPLVLIAFFRRHWNDERVENPTRGRLYVWGPIALAFAVVSFTVLRNVPLYPFTLLAPHEVGSTTN